MSENNLKEAVNEDKHIENLLQGKDVNDDANDEVLMAFLDEEQKAEKQKEEVKVEEIKQPESNIEKQSSPKQEETIKNIENDLIQNDKKETSEIMNISDLEDEEGNILNKETAKQNIEEKKELEVEQQIINIKEELGLGDIQESFIPSSTLGTENERYLYCSLVGRVISKKDKEFKIINVQFSDNSNKKNISFIDTNNFHLAVLNNVGLLLANKVEEENLDEYENEEKKDNNAIIQFKTTLVQNLNFFNDWTFRLPPDENPVLLAIGSDWCCVYTSQSFIRIFSIFGGEKLQLSVSTTILSICGFDNYLCYVYHSSIPFANSQHLRFKILDSHLNFKEICDDEVCISVDSNLIWFGFSTEGYLVSYDSYNILRAFLFNIQNNWIPLIDFGEKYIGKQTNFWLVGVEDGEVSGIEIKGDQIEPNVTKVPLLKTYKIVDNIDNENDCKKDYLLIKFYEKRYQKYKDLANIKDISFPEYYYTDELKDDKELKQMKKEHDKKVLNKINNLIIGGENNRIINFYETLLLKKSKEIVINVAKEYKVNDLVNYLRYKLYLSNIIDEQDSKDIPAVHQIKQDDVVIHNSNNNSSKDYKDISALAIDLSKYNSLNKSIKQDLETKGIISNDGNDEDKEEDIKPDNSNIFHPKNIKTNEHKSTSHDLFGDLNEVATNNNNIDNNNQMKGSKLGFKMKRKELLSAAIPKDNNYKKLKK